MTKKGISIFQIVTIQVSFTSERNSRSMIHLTFAKKNDTKHISRKNLDRSHMYKTTFGTLSIEKYTTQNVYPYVIKFRNPALAKKSIWTKSNKKIKQGTHQARPLDDPPQRTHKAKEHSLRYGSRPYYGGRGWWNGILWAIMLRKQINGGTRFFFFFTKMWIYRDLIIP